ncbi:CAP domain-containing protein [Thermodesulfobacteriota bacterium]
MFRYIDRKVRGVGLLKCIGRPRNGSQRLKLLLNFNKWYEPKPLRWDKGLTVIAKIHSQDMFERDYFDHKNLEGDGPNERAMRLDVEIQNGNQCGISENIGQTPIGRVRDYGIVSDELDVAICVMKGWMKSPGHRENILDETFDEIGIGTFYFVSYCWNTQDFR